MENNSNGIAWFGDVYRKLETICLEAEEVVWKEGFKYVEDQVQTVGENVKQFCTEFAREVLPESLLVDNAVSGPPEIETSDGVNQISIKSMDSDPLENQTCEERVSMEASSDELIKHTHNIDPSEERISSLMHDKFEMTLVEKYSEIKQLNQEVSEKVAEEDNGPLSYPASDFGESIPVVEQHNLGVPEKVSEEDNDPLAYPVLDISESIPDIPSPSSAVLDESHEHRFLGIEFPSDSVSARLTGKSDATIDAEDGTVDSTTLVGSDCKEQLDGSCIIVSGLELNKLSTEARPRSFKKKVGSALRIGRRSSKRGCSEHDLRHSEGACKAVSSSSVTTIQCEESSDSDWEII